MKIYTKTGDKGKTQHKTGRIYKNDPKVHILGILDELHAHMTMIHPTSKICENSCVLHGDEELPFEVIREQITEIQCHLIDLGSFYSGYAEYVPTTENLEKWIDQFDQTLPPLKHFIIPNPNFQIESVIHICRSVARKLERYVIDEIDEFEKSIPYVNRLSDYLFTIGRVVGNLTGNDRAVHVVNGKHEILYK